MNRKEVKQSEIYEATRYCFECPNCGDYIELQTLPKVGEFIFCPNEDECLDVIIKISQD